MTYLIAGLGAFLSLVVWLWRKNAKQAEATIDDLTNHLEEERDKLYAVIERKNKYIRELEESLIGFADPADILDKLFSNESDQGRSSN